MDEKTLNKIYRLLVSCASEAVYVFNEKGDIVLTNATAETEAGYADFGGVNITDIYPMSIHLKEGKLELPEYETVQTFAYRQNKTCYPVKLKIVALEDCDGLYASYAVNDSERYDAVRNHRKAMEDVEEATKMKNEFTANITHELRTPINGIKGMAEGLADTELSSEQAETVSIILHCCDNMTKIINDILDFSKIEAGKIELEEREFSLNKFLNDTLTFHIGAINEKGLKLIVNASGNIPDSLIGDELRLGQILNNLFSNAIKFTSSGHIGLEVTANSISSSETELFFMVMDTGIGISPEEKDKLFRSFSQVDGSITRRFGGTGLGLAITKQLVGLMGGSINVESEKGKGTTFSFSVKMKIGESKDTKLNFPEGSFVFTKNIPMASKADQEINKYSFGNDSFVPKPGDYSDEETPQFVFTNSEDSEDKRELKENMEKLMISIEMGSWEKAENFAQIIKNVLGDGDREIKNKAFALLLNVRKEKYELCIKLLEELEALLWSAPNESAGL